MIKNKVEVEIILTDKGNIRIGHGGSALVVDNRDNVALIPFLQVALFSSLGIIDKMTFEVGDRINSGGVLGTVTKANKTDIFITALMDDDGKELEINRKYVEKIK